MGTITEYSSYSCQHVNLHTMMPHPQTTMLYRLYHWVRSKKICVAQNTVLGQQCLFLCQQYIMLSCVIWSPICFQQVAS